MGRRGTEEGLKEGEGKSTWREKTRRVKGRDKDKNWEEGSQDSSGLIGERGG